MRQLAIITQALKEFATRVFVAFFIILSMAGADFSIEEHCELGKMHSFVTLTYLKISALIYWLHEYSLL